MINISRYKNIIICDMKLTLILYSNSVHINKSFYKIINMYIIIEKLS